MGPRVRRAALAAALATAGCMDTGRPVLGGLKIGPPVEGPFVMPTLLNERMPFDYPRDAWDRGVGGETLLRIHISAVGAIDTVAVAESSGDPVLDSAAVAGARLLRYKPAHRGERPMAVWAFLPVRYPQPEVADPPADAEERDRP